MVFSPSTVTVVENSGSIGHFYWTQPSSSSQFKIELHYAMVDGVSGIYSWAKYTNDQGGSISLGETRTVSFLQEIWNLSDCKFGVGVPFQPIHFD